MLTYALDISDDQAVKSTFATVREKLGPGNDIDILVLCAAQLPPVGPALSYSTSEIRVFMDTNILGNITVVRNFLCTEDAAKPALVANKTILEVATNGAYVLYPTMSLYSITKGAFTMFLRHVAAEYEGTGLRVHSFNPGSVLTAPAKEAGMDENSAPWDDVSLPAGFAVWLASPQASFLNGRYVSSNWDVDELTAKKDNFLADQDLGKIVLKV